MASTDKWSGNDHNAPTAGEMMDLYRAGVDEGDEARLRSQIEQVRLLCRMEHTVDVPDEYKQISKVIKLPHLRDTWQRTASAMLSKPPVVHVDPRTAEDDARRAANLAEKWDTNAMELMNRTLGEDTIMESARELIRDGESVLKVVHKSDAWANFPDRQEDEEADTYNKKTDKWLKGAPWPFAWRTVDRLQMVFGNGEYSDEWAVEYGEYPLPLLRGKYGVAIDASQATPEDTLGGVPAPEGWLSTSRGRAVKLEYVNADWWCVAIGGQMAKGFPKPNPYKPHLNYFRAILPDSESLLYSLLYLMPAVDRAVTMKQNWATLAAYPSPQLRPVAGMLPTMVDAGLSLDSKPPPFIWKPGKTVQSPIGYEFGFVSPPPTGQDLNDMIRLLMSLLEVAGIPSVMRGISSSGDSGYLANQMLAAASMSFKIGLRALGRQFEQALELLHWMVSHIVHQPVFINCPGDETSEFLAIGPDDTLNQTQAPVKLLGPVSLRFRPALPTDEQANAMIGIQTVNSPKQMLSRKRALERYFQEEDPEGALDEIYTEQALDSEPLKSIIMQHALKDAFPELAAQTQPAPNPASALVGPNGQPLINQNGSLGAAEMMSGVPSVQGLNTPIQPGRAGMFPGAPSTPTSTGGR